MIVNTSSSIKVAEREFPLPIFLELIMRLMLAVAAILLCQTVHADEPVIFRVPPGYEDVYPGSTIHVDYYDYVIRGDGTMVLADSPVHSMAGMWPHASAWDKPHQTDGYGYRGGPRPRPNHYQKRGWLSWTR